MVHDDGHILREAASAKGRSDNKKRSGKVTS